MALIECKECGNQVSDKAKVCPKCGAKIKASKTKEVTIKDEEKLKKNNWAKTSIVVALCLIVFISDKTAYGGYGMYGYMGLLVISSWLIWRGIAAFRYLSKGKSKLTLLRLRNKGLTILMCILGISGVVSVVIDMCQLEEYEKWRKASLLSSYSFRTGSPYSSKWSYFEWHYKDSLYANNVKRIDWKSVENKIVISAHLRAFDTSTDLVMSIVHRNGVGDAILLDITDAHTNRYLNEFDIVTLKSFEDKIPIKICIDRNYPLVLECPYTFASRSADGTAWFSLLIYGEDYEMMLDELKKGKSCFITIDNVDKAYKFDIEGLEWGEAIANDVVAENEQEVVKIDSTKVSYASEPIQQAKGVITENAKGVITENVKYLSVYDFPATDERIKIEHDAEKSRKVDSSEPCNVYNIYVEGNYVQEIELYFHPKYIRFIDINFDGLTDILFGIPNNRSYAFIWNSAYNKFETDRTLNSYNDCALTNPYFDIVNKVVYNYHEGVYDCYYSKYTYDGRKFVENETLRHIFDLNEYKQRYDYQNEQVYLFHLYGNKEGLKTNDKSELPKEWQNVIDNLKEYNE